MGWFDNETDVTDFFDSPGVGVLIQNGETLLGPTIAAAERLPLERATARAQAITGPVPSSGPAPDWSWSDMGNIARDYSDRARATTEALIRTPSQRATLERQVEEAKAASNFGRAVSGAEYFSEFGRNLIDELAYGPGTVGLAYNVANTAASLTTLPTMQGDFMEWTGIPGVSYLGRKLAESGRSTYAFFEPGIKGLEDERDNIPTLLGQLNFEAGNILFESQKNMALYGTLNSSGYWGDIFAPILDEHSYMQETKDTSAAKLPAAVRQVTRYAGDMLLNKLLPRGKYGWADETLDYLNLPENYMWQPATDPGGIIDRVLQ